jgi:hypothetical protein
MAGDWIQMRHDLPDDPAVIGIAELTGLDEYGVIGRLHRVWTWADRQTIDGFAPIIKASQDRNAPSVTNVTEPALRNAHDSVALSWLDRYVHRDGFGAAMVAVGWLEISERGGMLGILIPKFDEYISESSKQRALTSRRAKKHRTKRNAPSVTNVTEPALRKRDGSVTFRAPKGEGEEREIPTESLRDGTGDSSLDGTGRDGTSFCVDWEKARFDAKAFNGLISAAKPQDRSLVLKVCALTQGLMPVAWLQDGIEMLRFKSRKNPAAYLTALLKKKAAEENQDFRRMLALVKLPEEAP